MTTSTQPLTTTGTWKPPAEDLYGRQRASQELDATVDRRDEDLSFSAQLPEGATHRVTTSSSPHGSSWSRRPEMSILGLSGSLRADSHNTRLLAAAAAELPDGTELRVYDGLAEIPPYRQDAEEPAPEAVRALREAIAASDAVLIATPEYNGSLPGQLKNALDWASRPHGAGVLRGKPVVVVGASPGRFGAAWAQADARRILGIIGADVMDAELAVAQAHEAFDADGRLASAELRAQLYEILGQLVERIIPVAA